MSQKSWLRSAVIALTALSILAGGVAAKKAWAQNHAVAVTAAADTTVGPMVAVDTTMTELKAPQLAPRVFEVEIKDRAGHRRTVVITVRNPERIDSVEAGVVER